MDKEIKTLKPFKYLCMTIGNLPTSYIESMSYYETLCWLCKYLENTVTPAVNNNAEALQELQDYVTNYFENLDVQEEINNKLDEMAEDGELVEIIGAYLESVGLIVFNTKADMVSAINIQEGSKCKTLGTTTYNDGHGETYLIRTLTSGDTVDNDNIVALNISNTLIAEKIPYYLTTTVSNLNTALTNLSNVAITTNGNFATITGGFTFSQDTNIEEIKYLTANLTFSYPTGFNKNNCVVLALTSGPQNDANFYGGSTFPTVTKYDGDDFVSDVDTYGESYSAYNGPYGAGLAYQMANDNIVIHITGVPNKVIGSGLCRIRVILMKIA